MGVAGAFQDFRRSTRIGGDVLIYRLTSHPVEQRDSQNVSDVFFHFRSTLTTLQVKREIFKQDAMFSL